MSALALVLGSLVAVIAVNALLRGRDLKAAASRSPYSQEQFLDYFSNDAVRPDVVREVRRYLQTFQGITDFPVRPDDDLYRVYGLCDEDLDDAVIEIAETCGCATPTNEAVEGMAPVQSVEDLIKLLSRLC